MVANLEYFVCQEILGKRLKLIWDMANNLMPNKIADALPTSTVL
jgi:hypothetical protein